MPGKNRKANKDKKIADKNEPLNGSKTRPRNGSQTKLNSNQALLTDDKLPAGGTAANGKGDSHGNSAMIIDSSQGSDQNMAIVSHPANKEVISGGRPGNNTHAGRNGVGGQDRTSRNSYDKHNKNQTNTNMQGEGPDSQCIDLVQRSSNQSQRMGGGAEATAKQNAVRDSQTQNSVVAIGQRRSSNQAGNSNQNSQLVSQSNNQNINPNIMNQYHQQQNGGHNGTTSKKRTLDQISNNVQLVNNIASPQSQRGGIPQDGRVEPNNEKDQLIAIYRQNFCPCTQEPCKKALSNKLRIFLKNSETFPQMQSLLYGCPRTDRQINILTMMLKKIHVQTFEFQEMDALLDLFIVVYYKCSQEVQLTLLDDIDKNMNMILETNCFKNLSNQRFNYLLIFVELYKFQNCMKISERNLQDGSQVNKDQVCDVMNIKKIKQRCKRYDPNANKKGKVTTSVDLKCPVHGELDRQVATFSCDSARKFISFTCFLIQFKFKLLNMEDIAQYEKNRQRQEMCNIIKCMLQECDPSLFYYPMRALQEFYFQEVSEKSLGKRLSCDSFLQYKLKKERQGRNNLLTDFKKLSIMSKQNSHSFQHHQYQNYLLIYHDTIALISKIIKVCKRDCHIVCLKILQKLTEIQKSNRHSDSELYSRSQLINFKVECLQAMASKGGLTKLNDREKQMFFDEVRELIQEIQEGWKQRQLIAEKRRRDRKMRNNVEDSDSDLNENKMQQDHHRSNSMQNYRENHLGRMSYNTIGSPVFNKQHAYNKSRNTILPVETYKDDNQSHDTKVPLTNHPDLSILETLLTMDTIREFPKLSLLVFQALRPIMPIFMNSYIQILDKCEKYNLFEFCQIIDQSQQQKLNKEDQIMEGHNQVSSSKLKKFNCRGTRENAIHIWMNGQKYRSELERRMNQQMQMQNQGINNVNGQQIGSGKKGEMLQHADHQVEVKRLCRLRRKFTSNEIVFVFDFLLVMCRHAVYRQDQIAYSIGTHLIQDFYDKTKRMFDIVILQNPDITSELLALNFEMRSKKFIEEQSIQNSLMSEDETPKDEIFQQLFDKVFKLITNPNLQPKIQDSTDFVRLVKQPSMSSYTSTFFKQIIRIFQTSRKFLNIEYVKPLVDQLITGSSSVQTQGIGQNDHQLLVIVNSLPLYLAIQMFFDPNQIGVPSGQSSEMLEKNDGGLTYKVWHVMKSEIDRIKDGVDKGIESPMLVMQRISNLIHVSTSMLQYFLCFQTPLVEKSSSSQIHSNNSQNQFTLSPIQQKTNQVSSQKSLPTFQNQQAPTSQYPTINQLFAQIQLHQQVQNQTGTSNASSLNALSGYPPTSKQKSSAHAPSAPPPLAQPTVQSQPPSSSALHRALPDSHAHARSAHASTGTSGSPSSSRAHLYENTFLIKRQKYCNFCSSQVPLPHPTSFTFSRKCAHCSMKNSCLLMPARFLCNMCIDHNFADLYRCEREEIPLEGVRDAPVLHSPAQVKVIQKVVTEALAIWQQDVERQRRRQPGTTAQSATGGGVAAGGVNAAGGGSGNAGSGAASGGGQGSTVAAAGGVSNGADGSKNGGSGGPGCGSGNGSFWESQEVGCVDKCCELRYMYSNIVAIMVSRMLKLMLWILKHRLTPEPNLLKKFNEMEGMETRLTSGFQLIKKRIVLIRKELKKIELEQLSKEQMQQL